MPAYPVFLFLLSRQGLTQCPGQSHTHTVNEWMNEAHYKGATTYPRPVAWLQNALNRSPLIHTTLQVVHYFLDILQTTVSGIKELSLSHTAHE